MRFSECLLYVLDCCNNSTDQIYIITIAHEIFLFTAAGGNHKSQSVQGLQNILQEPWLSAENLTGYTPSFSACYIMLCQIDYKGNWQSPSDQIIYGYIDKCTRTGYVRMFSVPDLMVQAQYLQIFLLDRSNLGCVQYCT